jgi:hypothetical protein
MTLEISGWLHPFGKCFIQSNNLGMKWTLYFFEEKDITSNIYSPECRSYISKSKWLDALEENNKTQTMKTFYKIGTIYYKNDFEP